MKIGITGGTGFIGQYLLPELAPEHTLTVITSRKGTEGLYQHPNLSYLTAPYDREGFRRAFEACEAVVHLGAKRSTPEREKSITSYFENMESTEALFAACAELDIRNVVSISSVAVYDAGLPSPCPETQAPSPRSNYGVAKLAIEGMARLYNRRCGMRIKSLRVAQVLGLGERGGYMPAVFLERCLRQEKLSVYGLGAGGKEYIYVKEDKNSIYIRELADIRSDIRAQYSPMPLKAALSSLLKIVTTQSMLLDKILFYDRSGKSKEIRLNQLSLACALNSLVLIVFG